VTDANGCSTDALPVTISQPSSAVSVSVTSDNSHLYFGAPGNQTATISATISGGTPNYTVTVTMNRALIFNYINNVGDEVWTGLAGSSINTTDPSSDPPITTVTSVSTGNINLVTVTLLDDADITVTVTDANNCTLSSSKVHIIAEDARCFAGKSAVTKVSMCHATGSTKNPYIQICVDQDAVQAHLDAGDVLGSCTTKSRDMNIGSAVEVNSSQVPNQTGTGPLTVKISPNPTSYYFTAALQSLSKVNVSLVVTDITGRVVEQRTNIAANSTIQLGNSYHPGIYIAQFLQGTDKVTLRLIKEGR
jgi:hypothetical protein